MIIDMDAHYEPTADWLDSFPRLKRELPDKYPESDPRFALASAEEFAFFMSDDLLRHAPPERRMPIERLTTPSMELMFDITRSDAAGLGYKGATMNPEMTDPAVRIEWLDGQGIAKQVVTTGTGYTLARVIEDPDLGMRTLEAVNTWMGERSKGHADRIMPTTTLRWEDPDWCVRELTRMRELGSRTFLINAEPVGDRPTTHPDYDPVWAAASELGMIGVIHVGLSPATFHPGWSNTDKPAIVRLLATLHMSRTAETWLTSAIFEGVFERHPALTVLMSEQGIAWVAPLIRRLDAFVASKGRDVRIGRYAHSLTPSEFAARNLRVSPLPTDAENPTALLDAFPTVGVFASDYPHFEGSGDPVGHYAGVFADRDDEVVEGFHSENILASYAAMGDPLL